MNKKSRLKQSHAICYQTGQDLSNDYTWAWGEGTMKPRSWRSLQKPEELCQIPILYEKKRRPVIGLRGSLLVALRRGTRLEVGREVGRQRSNLRRLVQCLGW